MVSLVAEANSRFCYFAAVGGAKLWIFLIETKYAGSGTHRAGLCTLTLHRGGGGPLSLLLLSDGGAAAAACL